MFNYHHGSTDLLKLSLGCLNFCYLRDFFDGRPNCVLHSLVDFNVTVELSGHEFFHEFTFALELNLFRTLGLIVKEFSVQVEHHVFCNLLHVLINIFVQQRVVIQFHSHAFIEIKEQFRKPSVLLVIVREELITDASFFDFVNEVNNVYDFEFVLVLVEARDQSHINFLGKVLLFRDWHWAHWLNIVLLSFNSCRPVHTEVWYFLILKDLCLP